MPALVAGIHVLWLCGKKDVDGRVQPGHDERMQVVANVTFQLARCFAG
jgi:hypothetical protein